MQRWRILSRKKRFRWIAFTLVVLVLLVALLHQLLFIGHTREKDTLTRIRERGQLIALTDVNSLNYFIYKGVSAGYQLDLLNSFTKELGVSLKILCSNDISKLYFYLDLRVADIIALNLPISNEGKYLVNYTKPLGETKFVLVQRKPGQGKQRKYISSYADFTLDTIYYQSDAFYLPWIIKFHEQTKGRVILRDDKSSNPEQLVRMVSEGKIRFAICPENLAVLLTKYYKNIDAGLALSGTYQYAWGTGYSSDSLIGKLNEWIDKKTKEQELEKIFTDYYDDSKVVSYFQSDYSTLNKVRICPFDGELKQQSKLIHWDWRLLASLIYEESNFHLGKVSGKNASGLMQLMPETAGKFGMDSTASPAKQIAAGIKYIKWLDHQLLDVIRNPRERIYFILAAYNVGLGRILSARDKAVRYGKDPNKWNNNVDYYLTRKSRKEPIQKADTSQLSGLPEPAGYVNNILERYYHYKNLVPQ
ncbi:MAG: transglycosylase SLT domain-containing protein [Bacteroidetes bacterium]|nr:transglycosylase SLT domain-containing protein [Bacteroidota bacterium]